MLEYVTYTGPKKYGCVDVKGRVPKVFKKFYFRKGDRYYVHYDVPLSLADWLCRYCGGIFSRVEERQPEEYLKGMILEDVGRYMSLTGADAYESLSTVVEGLIEMGCDNPDGEFVEKVRDMIMEVFREAYKAGQGGDNGSGKGEGEV